MLLLQYKNGSKVLHKCQTSYLDMRVRTIAHEMLDTKLLKKLSWVRHGWNRIQVPSTLSSKTVLVKLYNKYRDFKRWKFVDDYQDEFAQGMCTLMYLLPDPPSLTLGSQKTHFYGQFNPEKNLLRSSFRDFWQKFKTKF